MRVIGFLNEPICLDADPAATGMGVLDPIECFNAGSSAIFNFYLHEIRACHALITKRLHGFFCSLVHNLTFLSLLSKKFFMFGI